MKTRVDRNFREQSRSFELRFTCEACVHHDEEANRCSNGYPDAAHRARPLELIQELEFCKEFELA